LETDEESWESNDTDRVSDYIPFSHNFICFPFRFILVSVSLGQMGWKWKDFSPSNQQKMEVEIHKDLIIGDLVGISSYLTGLLALDYPLCDNQRMKDVLFTGLSRAEVDYTENSRVVANIVYSLGQLSIDWASLPQKVQKCFFDRIECCSSGFNGQHISNLIYGYIANCYSY
jgi:hypothetical protein